MSSFCIYFSQKVQSLLGFLVFNVLHSVLFPVNIKLQGTKFHSASKNLSLSFNAAYPPWLPSIFINPLMSNDDACIVIWL